MSERYDVIDMRCRPAYLHDFFGATPGSAAFETARWLNRRVGTRGDDQHFTRSLSEEGFLAEVREAGLNRAVVVGRHTPSQHLPNDRIHQIVAPHPELIGMGAVDPALQGVDGAIAEIDRAIKELRLSAINLEPGFAEPARHPDDALYFPIYEHCAALGVPVSLMSGPTTPDPRCNDPSGLARVAQAFPTLPLIAYHGYWPNVAQAIGLAFRYENIHLVPDMYLFQPGSQLYIEAANSFLSDQLLFGSSYPFRPIRQSIEDFLAFGLPDAINENVLYTNAKRLLNIQ
jgi:predicted TIM-barrel fold metal-dependent hydrolase